MTVCDRCHQDALATIVSYFNHDTLCFACKNRERQHPQYRAAVEAECKAVLSGDLNYQGIGLPPELRGDA